MPVALAAPAEAALHCGDDQYNGVRTCTAGIRSSLIVSSAANTTQYSSQWCWAACVQGLFRFYGHSLSQETIVRQVYGGLVDMPVSGAQLLRILNGTWSDDRGVRFRVQADGMSATAETAAHDLANDMPLIIGTYSHAVVLTAMTYAFVPSPYGVQTQILDAVVRDPWPGRGRRSLSVGEWQSIVFAARVRVV